MTRNISLFVKRLHHASTFENLKLLRFVNTQSDTVSGVKRSWIGPENKMSQSFSAEAFPRERGVYAVKSDMES